MSEQPAADLFDDPSSEDLAGLIPGLIVRDPWWRDVLYLLAGAAIPVVLYGVLWGVGQAVFF